MAAGASPVQALDRMTALDFSREMARLTQDFTGRQWLFQNVDSWLRGGHDRFFLLTGEPGAGKSAIAARLIQTRNDIGAYHFCIAGRSETVTPGVVLRSLAVQLAQRLPEYGLALLNTIKPVHLSLQINLRVDTMTGGQITGLVIHHLSASDPQQEFEILLRAPLAALPVPATPLVLLVDSLDEAVTFAGDPNLVALLVKELPPWVRWLLTTRPENRVLRYFKGQNPVVLAAESQMNLEDIHQYVVTRTGRAPLADRVREAGVEPQALVERLTNDLSTGNFLYTKVLLDDIEAGRQPLTRLDELPRSLDDIYHRFLERFSVTEWQQQYQPILAVLTAALEPVTETQLAKFTGMERTTLRQNLGVAGQFLDVLEPDEGEKVYRLFHQSLRDYLESEERNQDFWCAPEDNHRRIARAYGVSEKTCDAGSLEKVDDYGLLHLATHVLRAGWDEALRQLLGGAWARIKERREGSLSGFLSDIGLAWRKAETDNDMGLQIRYSLFQSSVRALAGQLPPALVSAAVRQNVWQPVQALRYAWEITDETQRGEVLIALAPMLTPSLLENAVQLARTIQYADKRIQPLAALGARAPESMHSEIARETLEAIRTLQYDSSKEAMLAAVSGWLPAAEMATALEIALSIPFVDNRAAALAALLPNLPEALIPQTRSAVESLTGAFPQIVDALMVLARRAPAGDRPGIWRRALATIGDLKDRDAGASLARLAPELPDELLPKAVAAALKMTGPFDQTIAAAALLPRLTIEKREPLLAAGLQAIRGMPFGTDPVRVRWYAALLPFFPDDEAAGVLATALAELRENTWITAKVVGLACLIPQVHEGVRKALRAEAMLAMGLPDRSSRRSESMVSLAPQLLPTERSSLLKLVPTMKDEDGESAALAGMAPYLSENDLGQALEMADGMAEAKYRLRVVEHLAPYLSANRLPRALAVARSIRDRDARGRGLLDLALTQSPEDCPLLPARILEAVNFIEPPADRAQALYRLTPWLPESLHSQGWTCFLAALRACQPYHLGTVLGPLTELPEPVLNDVLNLIDKLFAPTDRLEALLSQASRLPPPRLQTVIEGVLDLALAESRAKALVHILPYVAAGDGEQYVKSLLNRVADQQEYDRAGTIAVLASSLHNELLDAALAMAQKIKSDGYRAKALCALLPYLLEQRRKSILKEALLATTASQEWSVAGKLAPYLDAPTMENVLTAVSSIYTLEFRARGLAALIPYVEESRRPQVADELLTTCRGMPFAVELLVQAAPYLPAEGRRREMIAAVHQPDYAHRQARGLIDVLPFVAMEERAQYLIDSLTVGSHWGPSRERAKAWSGLIEAWQRLPEQDARSVWQHGLRALAARPGPDLFEDLAVLVPMLKSLGGETALADSVRAVEEACAIWP